MRIDEIIAAGGDPVFSFEFFPPKTAEGEARLFEDARGRHRRADRADHRAPGIHFHTINRSPATRAILSALRLQRPWSTGPGADPALRLATA